MQCGECGGLVEFVHDQVDSRRPLGESRDRRNDQAPDRGGEGADRDWPAEPSGQGERLGLGVGEDGGEPVAVRGEAAAGCGEGERALAAASGSVEQDEPGLTLKRRQVLRHPGRGEVQAMARRDDAPCVGDRTQHQQPAGREAHAAAL